MDIDDVAPLNSAAACSGAHAASALVATAACSGSRSAACDEASISDANSKTETSTLPDAMSASVTEQSVADAQGTFFERESLLY
jgi:hypothetical protein